MWVSNLFINQHFEVPVGKHKRRLIQLFNRDFLTLDRYTYVRGSFNKSLEKGRTINYLGLFFFYFST